MNYITILDFMVNDLKLKGNELIIYALIYGFSQDAISDFHGSLSYIQNRTGLSRPTVVDVLNKLIEKKLIIKEKKTNKCVYITSKETLLALVKNLNQTSKETLLNNKYIKEIDNTNINNSLVGQVIDYLNKKTNSKFNPMSRNNRLSICGRIAEGYTLEDFKKVIDIKAKEWLGTPMEQYLRPKTLFSPTNFESYINQKKAYRKNDSSKTAVTSTEEEYPLL